MNSSEQLMHDLFREFPDLEPLMAEHLEDQEGELLPYLLMADLVRWAQQKVNGNPERVSALIAWLEIHCEQADEPVRNLIAVGFVENIPATPEGDPLLTLLGPSLRQFAQDMNLFEPWDRDI